MNRLGSDVVALAAILGSGAVGGVVTLAALERGAQPAVEECLAASAMPAPRIVVEVRFGEPLSAVVGEGRKALALRAREAVAGLLGREV